MPTHQELAELYQSSINELLAVKLNFDSTPEQIDAANAAIDELNTAWIDAIQVRYQERTASLNVLVERLNAVSNSIESGPMDTIKARLNEAAARTRNVLHKTAREALENIGGGAGDDADAVSEVPEALEGEPPSPRAASDDMSGEGDIEPPARPSIPPVRPGVAARRVRSRVPRELFDDYSRLFAACLIRSERIGEVNGHLGKLLDRDDTYRRVGDPLGIPWWFVGVIHGLESSYLLTRHLHNGDPLSAPTVHVPNNRPPGWADSTDKSWAASARDALTLKKLDEWDDWSMQGALYQWERYNGFGYRKFHPSVLSPYLWSHTNHYVRGKYVADGRFDSECVSRQAGAAAILRQLVNTGEVPGS